jgi:hypothetical protein
MLILPLSFHAVSLLLLFYYAMPPALRRAATAARAMALSPPMPDGALSAAAADADFFFFFFSPLLIARLFSPFSLITAFRLAPLLASRHAMPPISPAPMIFDYAFRR